MTPAPALPARRFRPLVPATRLLWLVGLALAAALAASIDPDFLPAWTVLAVALFVVALADLVAAFRAAAPAARREVPGSLPLGVRDEISLRFANEAAHPITLDAYDHHPPGFETEGLPQRVTVPAHGWAALRYAVRPVERGVAHFGQVETRIASPLGLWLRTRYLGEECDVRVYPNFAALTGYALMATDNRLSQLGVLQRRRRGEGLDFHQLREYREGDVPRQIDWKATARTVKLVSREYQDERDQQVLLVVDCGRRMSARDGELSHFDHVLNAALLVAYVSLRQGDAVGLMTMSGERRYLAPRKSQATINLILNRVFDLQPSLAASDYYDAALEVMKRFRKRTLIIILSNMRDEDDDTLGPALRLLQSRHLVLFASLRENILTRALAARVDTFERALTHAAAAGYLGARELAFKRIEKGGAVCLDVEPEDLPIALVNRYLDIKRSGRL
ncbi:MAG: DUF58 domain-containing protein [Betaproteobacteria bacterium]|nr:DUF58 domain-containing protein [Betaproteobacteria bacterium]